jgi:sigma-B regulation protein RsbU (phosphoserine phosphatase)
VGLSEEGDYQELTVDLQPGYRVILFSDGITEARHGQEFFGEARFYELVRSSISMDVKEAVDYVVTELKNWSENESFADDISLLVIEATQD